MLRSSNCLFMFRNGFKMSVANFDNLILIDIGCNLTHKKYAKDLDSVMNRATTAGVKKIIVTGTSVKVSKEALRLTRLYPGTLYSTAGIHPHDAKTFDENAMQELQAIAANSECVAIGECGLDYNRNFSEPEIQKIVFRKQVELACQLKKPLFVHEREAHQDLLAILDEFSDRLPAVVIHCFTGTVQQALTYIDRQYFLGLTSFFTKEKVDDGVRKLLTDRSIPLNRLLVETDAPYLFPNIAASKLLPNVKSAITERSKMYLQRYCTFQRNEPCSLPVIVEMIAAYMKMKPEELAVATTYNALKLFGLS